MDNLLDLYSAQYSVQFAVICCLHQLSLDLYVSSTVAHLHWAGNQGHCSLSLITRHTYRTSSFIGVPCVLALQVAVTVCHNVSKSGSVYGLVSCCSLLYSGFKAAAADMHATRAHTLRCGSGRLFASLLCYLLFETQFWQTNREHAGGQEYVSICLRLILHPSCQLSTKLKVISTRL